MALLSLVLASANVTSTAAWNTFSQYTTNDNVVTITGTATPGDFLQLIMTADGTSYYSAVYGASLTVPLSGVFTFSNVYLPITNSYVFGTPYVPVSQNQVGVLVNVDTAIIPYSSWSTSYNSTTSSVRITRQNISTDSAECSLSSNPIIAGDCFVNTSWKTARSGTVNTGTLATPVYTDAAVSDVGSQKIVVTRDLTQVGPNGLLGVDIVTRVSSASTGYIYQEIDLDPSLDYTHTLYVKTVAGHQEPAIRLGMASATVVDAAGVSNFTTATASFGYVSNVGGPTYSGWRRVGVAQFGFSNPYLDRPGSFAEYAAAPPNTYKIRLKIVIGFDGGLGDSIAIWGLKTTGGNSTRNSAPFPSTLPFNPYTGLITMDSLGHVINGVSEYVYNPSIDGFTVPSVSSPIATLISAPFSQALRVFDYNMLTYTDDLTHIEWIRANGYFGNTPLVVTPRSAPTWNTTPIAATAGTKLTQNSSNQRINELITLKASKTYTFSFYYSQENTAGPQSYVKGKVYIPSRGNENTPNGFCNTAWQRYVYTFTTPASPATQSCEIGLVASTLSAAGTSGDFFIYGMQLLEGTTPSTYIVPWLLSLIPTNLNAKILRIVKDNSRISGAINGGYYSAGEQNRLVASSHFDGAYVSNNKPVKYWNTYKFNAWISGREVGPLPGSIADVLIKGNPSNSGNFEQTIRGGLVPGRTYCISTYAKTASLPFWDPTKTGYNLDGSTHVYDTSIRLNANIAFPTFLSTTINAGSATPNWQIPTTLKFKDIHGAVIGTGTTAYYKLEDNCPVPRPAWLGTYRLYILNFSVPTYKRRGIELIEGYDVSNTLVWSLSPSGTNVDREGFADGGLPSSSPFYMLGTSDYRSTNPGWTRYTAFFIANEEMANLGVQFQVLDTGAYGQPVAFYGAEFREIDSIQPYVADTYAPWVLGAGISNKSDVRKTASISFTSGTLVVKPHKALEQKSAARIGLNLAGTNYYNTDFMYYDMFKSARAGKRAWTTAGTTVDQLNTPFPDLHTGWITANSAVTWDAGLPLDLDADGWVRSIPTGEWVYALMMRVDGPWWSEYPTPPYPAGDYVCLYDGEGTIDWTSTILLDNSGHPSSNIVRVISAAAGRHVIQLDANRKGGVLMKISYTNPANYIRNIRFLMPGFESQSNYDVAHGNIPWHPKYLQQWGQFDTFRYMEAHAINASPVRTWDMRALPTDAANSRGQSFEHCIDLCNRTNTNAWFCIPHAATEDYVRGMAAIIRDTLNKNLKVYIEYSNEWWNSSFLQHYWLGLYGDENGLGDPNASWPPWDTSLESYGFNSQKALDIFLDEFGSFNNRSSDAGAWSAAVKPKRIYTVMSGWRDSLENNQIMWNYGKKWTKRVDGIPYDCVTTDGYYGVNTGEADGLKPKEVTVDDIMASSVNYVEEARIAQVIQHNQVVNTFGAEHLVYEGGPHFTQVGPYTPGAIDPTEKLLVDASRDPRDKAIVKTHLTNWNQLSGNGLFNWFTSSGAYGKFGAFGLTDGANRSYADLLAVPKYSGVIEIAGFDIPAMPTISVINPNEITVIGPASMYVGVTQANGSTHNGPPQLVSSAINTVTMHVTPSGVTAATSTGTSASTTLTTSPNAKQFQIGGNGNLKRLQSK